MLTTTGSSDCFFMSVRTLEECKRHMTAGMVGEEGGKECEKKKGTLLHGGSAYTGGGGAGENARVGSQERGRGGKRPQSDSRLHKYPKAD